MAGDEWMYRLTLPPSDSLLMNFGSTVKIKQLYLRAMVGGLPFFGGRALSGLSVAARWN